MSLLNEISSEDLALFTSWRHELHQHPELGLQEQWTSEYIYKKCESFGVDTLHYGLAKTGVVAIVKGHLGEGKSLGLRADMDALPLEEANELPYKSQFKGQMHACGHDGHTAILLGLAKLLCENRDFKGQVVLIFQPAEEGLGGAKIMLEDGLFEKFPVDVVFGLHNWPSLPQGQIGIIDGPIMAAADRFTLRIRGTGGHAALPHQTRDPLIMGAQIVTSLQALSSRMQDPNRPMVLSLTKFHAGTAFNIIPDEAVLEGTVRTLCSKNQDFIQEQMERISSGIAEALGGKAQLDYKKGYPVTINSSEETKICREVALQLVGEANMPKDLKASLGGEDFSYMLQKKPGCYFWLGAGRPERGDCTIHSPHFDFNDELISLGIRFWGRLVQAYSEELPST